MGIHTQRQPTPAGEPYKPGDVVRIPNYDGLWVVDEYLPPCDVPPQWSCRTAKKHGPDEGASIGSRESFIYITRYADEMVTAAGPTFAVVTGVALELETKIPGVSVTLAGVPYPLYAASPWDAEHFLKALYDFGIVVPDRFHAQIVDACDRYDKAFV